MKKIIFLIVLIVFLLTGLGGFFFWQKSHILGAKIVTPFFAPDNTFSFTTELEKAGIVLDSPPIVSGDTTTASISGTVVLFANNGNFATQITTLQLVLPRLKMEGRRITQIDLRFSKVVMR